MRSSRGSRAALDEFFDEVVGDVLAGYTGAQHRLRITRILMHQAVGPLAELQPVLGRHAQQIADDDDRQRNGQRRHELAPAVADELRELLTYQAAHPGFERGDRSRGEPRAHRSAQLVVLGIVEREDVARGVALAAPDVDPAGRAESLRIAGSGEDVGEAQQEPDRQVGVVGRPGRPHPVVHRIRVGDDSRVVRIERAGSRKIRRPRRHDELAPPARISRWRWG